MVDRAFPSRTHELTISDSGTPAPLADGTSSARTSPSAFLGDGQLEAHRHGITLPAFAQVSDILTGQSERERSRGSFLGDAELRRLAPVHRNDVALGCGFDAGIDVDDIRCRRKHVTNLRPTVRIAAIERPIDLGHDRGLHGRTGRHLDDLYRRAVSSADLRQAWPRGHGDFVALPVSADACQ